MGWGGGGGGLRGSHFVCHLIKTLARCTDFDYDRNSFSLNILYLFMLVFIYLFIFKLFFCLVMSRKERKCDKSETDVRTTPLDIHR